jgi:hypothetical protein
MLCPGQSPNLHCSHLVAYTPYQEQNSKEKKIQEPLMSVVPTAWAEEVEGSGDGGAPTTPATAGHLWCRLQRASNGTGGSGPPTVALLGEAPAAVGLTSDTSGWGSCGRGARRWRRKAGLGAGAFGRFSGGRGARRRCRRARLQWQWGSVLAVAWLLRR